MPCRKLTSNDFNTLHYVAGLDELGCDRFESFDILALRILSQAPTSAVLIFSDTPTVDLSLATNTVTANVKVSATANNQLTVQPDGLYVPPASAVVGESTTVSDSQTVDLVLTGTDITANVKISATADNKLSLNADGLYVAPATAGTGEATTVTDSQTVDLTLTGVDIKADVKVSATANNKLSVVADGLYVEEELVLDPSVCNNLTSSAAGLAQITREGVVRVCNLPGWENVIRNAAQDSRIEFDVGVFQRTDALPIALKRGQTIVGKGKRATRIQDVGAGGSLFRMTSPVNSSTRVDLMLADIGIYGMGVGVGFEDNCGTFITLRNAYIGNFDTNVILDQSEVVLIDDCIFEDAVTQCIWITNGADRTPGAFTEVSNQIKVMNCQISGGNRLTPILVRDDGGHSHSYIGNNWNGGQTQLWLTSGKGFSLIGGNEMEGAVDRAVRMDYLKPNGAGASGGCYGGVISGNTIVSRTGNNGVLSIISGGGVTIHGNIIGGNAGLGYVLNVFTGDGVSDLSWFSNSYDTIEFANRDAANSWQFTNGLAVTPYSGNPSKPAIQVRENTVVRKTIQNDGTII